MVQAISNPTASTQSTGSSPGAGIASLQAQLTRYQKVLSECVNCESSKTAQGKADIQAISVRISEVKERIDQIAGANSAGPVTKPAESASIDQARAKTEPTLISSPSGTVGGLLDTFA